MGQYVVHVYSPDFNPHHTHKNGVYEHIKRLFSLSSVPKIYSIRSIYLALTL